MNTTFNLDELTKSDLLRVSFHAIISDVAGEVYRHRLQVVQGKLPETIYGLDELSDLCDAVMAARAGKLTPTSAGTKLLWRLYEDNKA